LFLFTIESVARAELGDHYFTKWPVMNQKQL